MALLPPTVRPQAPQIETDRKEKHMENFNDSKALAIEIAKILDKKKAHDVRVLKVESLTVLTDYFVIASGTSTTQVASLAIPGSRPRQSHCRSGTSGTYMAVINADLLLEIVCNPHVCRL